MAHKIHVYREEECCDFPGGDIWKVISFRRQHADIGPRGEFSSIEVCLDYYVEHIKTGKAWFLDHYVHSGEVWSFHGEGPQCRWDTAKNAGMLVYICEDYEYPSREELKKAARQVLKEYNEWANGEVYGWEFILEDGTSDGGCGFIVGLEWLIDTIRDEIGDEPYEILTTETAVRRNEIGEQVKEMMAAQDAAKKGA